MASFSNQVAWKTGDSTSYAAQMPTWLNDGVRDVVDKCITMNPASERHFVSYGSILNSSGLAVETARILRVFRTDTDGKSIPAPMLPPGMFAQATDAGSIYAATETHPVSYQYDGKVFVWPAPSVASVVVYVNYGTVDDANGTVTNFPSVFDRFLVCYAGIRSQEYRRGVLVGELETLESGLSATSALIDDHYDDIAASRADIQTRLTTIASLRANFATYAYSGASSLYEMRDDVSAYLTEIDTAFTAVSGYIDTDEDVELASSKLSQAQLIGQKTQTRLAEAGIVGDTLGMRLKEIEVVFQELSAKLQEIAASQQAIAALNAKISAVRAEMEAKNLLIGQIGNTIALLTAEYQELPQVIGGIA